MTFPMRCDDDIVTSDSALMRRCDYIYEAMTKRGVDTATGNNFKGSLLKRRFVEVQEKARKTLGKMQRPNVLKIRYEMLGMGCLIECSPGAGPT